LTSSNEWFAVTEKYKGLVSISTLNTYELLANCSIQLSINGTTVFEGLQFGISNYSLASSYGIAKSKIWSSGISTTIPKDFLGPFIETSKDPEKQAIAIEMFSKFSPEALRAAITT
jgi:hypothetical protein